MAANVTFNNTAYVLPTTGEVGWSVPVTNFFIDLGAHAVDTATSQSIGGTKTFTGTVNLTGATLVGLTLAGITTTAPGLALTLDSSNNVIVANNLNVIGTATHSGATTLTGITTAGTINATTITATANYTSAAGNLTLTAGTLTAANIVLTNPAPLLQGGTGSTTASGARTNLGLANFADTTASNIFTNATQTFLDTTAGASAGPVITFRRNKGAGVNSDFVGALEFDAQNTSNTQKAVGKIALQLVTATAGSEASSMVLQTSVAGALTSVATLTAGVQVGAPTGGDQGAGTLNATTVYAAGVALTSSPARNIIHNGDFRLDQRNEGTLVTCGAGSSNVFDRWVVSSTAASKVSSQQAGGGVFPGSGFSAIMTVLASVSPAATDLYDIQQRIEGINWAQARWGTAGAQAVTISFQFQCSITGTFAVSLREFLGTRSYVSTFAYNNAGVNQYVTITVPGDTSGTWATSTLGSAILSIDFGSGSNFNATVNTWSAGNFVRTSGSTNWITTLAATMKFSNVQIELGSVATPFEMIDYGESLRRCQRYLWKTFAKGTAPAQNVGNATGELNSQPIVAGATMYITGAHPVIMRAAPSGILYNPAATNGQARDESLSADCNTTSLNRATDRLYLIVTIANASSTNGSLIGIHALLSAEL